MQSIHANMRKEDLIALADRQKQMLDQKERDLAKLSMARQELETQLAEAQKRISELEERIHQLEAQLDSAGVTASPAEPLRLPDGSPVTQEVVDQLAARAARVEELEEEVRQLRARAATPSRTDGRPSVPPPELYYRIRKLGPMDTDSVKPLTIAKIPMWLRGQLSQMVSWVEEQASTDTRFVRVKDWIVYTEMLRVGAILMRACPEMERLADRLPSTSQEAIEQTLRQIMLDWVADIMGWEK